MIRAHRIGPQYRIIWIIFTRWRPIYASINRRITRYRPWLGFEVAIVERAFYDEYLKRGEHS